MRPWALTHHFSSVLPRIIVLLLFASAIGFAQTADNSFSIVILPDTQNYSQYFPDIFQAQTQWIVDNRAALNIQMVIGVGDIVNHPDSLTEWANATKAADILDGKVPYTFAIGNHDYDGLAPSKRSATLFNQYFGPPRYAAYSWYGGNYKASNENFYTFFTVNGQKYMVLALEFYPRDEVLTWASSVIDSNPDAKIMVVTHSFLFPDGTRVDQCDTNDMLPSQGNNPQVTWQKLLSQKANVILVNSGHLVQTTSAHRTDLGINGNVVNQIFTNFQDTTNGGNGYLRILTYHPATNRIDVSTYSPYTKLYLTSSIFQFSLPITNDGNTAQLGAISGKVRNAGCAVLSGAQVSTAGFNSTSSSTGQYTIQGLTPNGQKGYNLAVSAAGYDTDSDAGTAVAGYADQVDFYLTASSGGSGSTVPCTLNTVDPSVTICAPANGSTVTSPVTVSAGATSSKTVQFMQVYLDGVVQTTIYAKIVNLQLAPSAGQHRLTVQMMDSAGVLTKNTIYFTVGTGTSGNTGGTAVAIGTPTNNAIVSSPVHVSASVTSDKSISYTQVYLDGVAKYTVYSKSVEVDIAASAGTHRLTVQAKDSAGTITKSTINFTVGATVAGTTVTINAPANNATVSSPVRVSASVTSDKTISYTQVYVDGVAKYTINSQTIDVYLPLASGAHRITVQAKDNAGVFTKSTINVTVQ